MKCYEIPQNWNNPMLRRVQIKFPTTPCCQICTIPSLRLQATITFPNLSRYGSYIFRVWWTNSKPRTSKFFMILCTKKYLNQFIFDWIILKNNKCAAVTEMGDRLATTDMGRKLGSASGPLTTIHQRHRQTGQTDNGPIASSEPFYKRLPKKCLTFFETR